jgi:glycerate dehydrogenase
MPIPSNTSHQIVFLDRNSLVATLRAPNFPHVWQDYSATDVVDVRERLQHATIAITNKVPLRAADLDSLPQLKMVAVAATGTNIVDVEACRERGIIVSNIRDYAGATLPEHTFALILALRRNLLAYRLDVEAGLWQEAKQFCLFGHPIRDLAGSRLGLVGYGKLGQAVANLGRAFGMEVCVHSRTAVDEPGITNLSLDELLTSSDVLSLHLPLSDKTRNMISTAQLARMKPSALLINTARGGLVNEDALAEALKNGTIGGAGFDVLTTEPPSAGNVLLNLRLPNFILTPHIAWASSEAMQTLAEQLVDNLNAFVAGTPTNVVG